MTRTEMMKELVAIQNETDFQDILTITGFMDDAQVALHLERQRSRMAERREA